MRHYETLFIVTPEISEEETEAVLSRYVGILEDGGAFMAKVDRWGRRRMAYTVKKFNKGFYTLFDYGADPEAVAEMERNFKIDEQVIRFLTVKKSDAFDLEAAQAAKEADEAAKEADEAAKAEQAEQAAAAKAEQAEQAAAAEASEASEASEEAPAAPETDQEQTENDADAESAQESKD